MSWRIPDEAPWETVKPQEPPAEPEEGQKAAEEGQE